MMHRQIINLIIFIYFISTFGFVSYASSLRLMAMGDMRGIVEDESDYIYDVTVLPFIKNNQLNISSGTVNYSESFENTNSDLKADYARSGKCGLYNMALAYKLNNDLAVYTSYFNQNIDSEMSYYASSGIDGPYKEYDVTSRKSGYIESTNIGIGYRTFDWLVLGAVAKSESVNYRYLENGIITLGGSGIVENKYKKTDILTASGVAIRLFNERAFLSFGYNALTPTIAAGYKIYPETLAFKAIFYGEAFDDSSISVYGRGAAGFTLKPVNNFICAISFAGTQNKVNRENMTSSSHLGIEYNLNEIYVIRGGTIYKGHLDHMFDKKVYGPMDLTFGIGYKQNNYSFELSALYYQDVPISVFNYWNAVPDRNLSRLTPFVYRDHTISQQRNLLLIMGMEYVF